MRKLLAAFFVAWFFYGPFAAPVRAGEPDNLTRLAEFLREHVIGRSIRSADTVNLDHGRIETEFKRSSTYSNLLIGEEALQFDVFSQIDQEIFDLDQDGKRSGSPIEKQRAGARRFELRQAKSTGELIGISRPLASKTDSSIGGASFVRVELEDDVLRFKVSTVGYNDSHARGGEFKPGASEIVHEIAVVDGKPKFRDIYQSFDVDPKTLKRTPAGDLITIESTLVE